MKIMTQAYTIINLSDSNINISENQQNQPSRKPSIPSYFKDLFSIIQYCNANKDHMNTIVSEKTTDLLDGSSKRYIDCKKSILNKFFNVMSQHPVFRYFRTVVNDPTFESKELPLFYIYLRGVKAEEKKFLLNQIMLWFAQKFKKLVTKK